MAVSPSIPSFALPGDSLSASTTRTPGLGTHMFDNQITASQAGPTHTQSSKGSANISIPSRAAIPNVGDTVLGRITRTTPRSANLDILALGPTGATLLPTPFAAQIRQQDIRATETDKVRMVESYRVGDVVRGVVISLGDERAYYVGTQGNEMGVVVAWSESGRQMVPVSWREMREVLADAEGGGLGATELRKVAKVV